MTARPLPAPDPLAEARAAHRDAAAAMLAARTALRPAPAARMDDPLSVARHDALVARGGPGSDGVRGGVPGGVPRLAVARPGGARRGGRRGGGRWRVVRRGGAHVGGRRAMSEQGERDRAMAELTSHVVEAKTRAGRAEGHLDALMAALTNPLYWAQRLERRGDAIPAEEVSRWMRDLWDAATLGKAAVEGLPVPQAPAPRVVPTAHVPQEVMTKRFLPERGKGRRDAAEGEQA